MNFKQIKTKKTYNIYIKQNKLKLKITKINKYKKKFKNKNINKLKNKHNKLYIYLNKT